jgi:hypothetical protein
MNFVKYLTAFSVFSVVAGSMLPANAINVSGTFSDGTDLSGSFKFNGNSFSDISLNTEDSPAFSATNYSLADNVALNNSDRLAIEDNSTGQVLDLQFDNAPTSLNSGTEFSDTSFPFDSRSVTDFNTNATPVPFETEATIGLVALGGYLWYRNRKKRNQALYQQSNN